LKHFSRRIPNERCAGKIKGNENDMKKHPQKRDTNKVCFNQGSGVGSHRLISKFQVNPEIEHTIPPQKFTRAFCVPHDPM